MRNILLAAAILLPVTTVTAHATDLSPLEGQVRNFRGGASALIYFEGQPDGYHVTTTVQSDSTANMKVFRFTAVLAAGQSTEISVPHEVGAGADVILIRRVGDRLVVDDGAAANRS